MTRFIVVPQWQGSPSARAMLLVDGAEAIEGDLPRAACTRVDVPLEAGESLDTGVHRLSAL
ncbi:arginase family protein, partial [Microbacterium sp. zg.Y909]|nr:arginase family protein [Microbacterium sp. zg.Y909]